MSDPSGTAVRRAEQLIRWYPEAWRSRYGDEFTELLISDICERPRCWRRSTDVVFSGLMARTAGTGLAGRMLDPRQQAPTALAALGCACGVFSLLAASMWSQLAIGWQWSRPDTLATTTATVVTSLLMAIFAVTALLAAAPVAWAVARDLVRRRERRMAAPAALLVAGGGFLIAGTYHFANGWPGTGGHHWAHQGLVPGGPAAFAWASTLSVSSYWAHPGALSAFPAAELAWMVASPIGFVCAVVGCAKVVRRVELTPKVLDYERRLGSCAIVAMIAFLAGTCVWLVDGGPGPRNLFHAGAIDVGSLAAMCAAAVVALRALGRTRAAAAALLPR